MFHSPQDARNHRRIIRTVRRVVCAHYGHLALIATCPHTLQVVHTHFSLSYLSLSAFMSLLSLQLARTHCKSFTHISLSLSAFMSLYQTQTHTISLSSFTQLFYLNYLFFHQLIAALFRVPKNNECSQSVRIKQTRRPAEKASAVINGILYL